MLDELVEGFEPAAELISVMAPKSAVVLGLDIGTSGTRAALFDESGQEIEGASVRVQSRVTKSPDFSEVDPDETVDLVSQAIDALLAKPYQTLFKIEDIAISCFWHSLVGVDAAGLPTTPVLGWAQRGGAKAVGELRKRFDEREIHRRTGCRFHPSYWTAKLLQLKNEQPQVFKATHLWLSFSEYLTLRLFGETATSVSMASGTGCFNQRTCEWDQDLLQTLGLSVDTLPRIAGSKEIFDSLRDEYASRWPQLSKARAHPAIGDGCANNIGSGCTTREKLALMIGTSGAMRMLYEGVPPAEIPPQLWCYRLDRTRVVVGGALSDGGGLYNWIRQSFPFNEDTEAIESQLAGLEPDGHGLTILPFWAGERSTGWSADARGAVLGLTMRTRPIEILRAAMEGIAYRFALIARALERFAPRAAVIASGNALRSSPVWVQVIADVLGKQVTLSGTAEASIRGAALLALEATGKIQSIEDFPVSVEKVIEPDLLRQARYREGLERQEEIYKNVFTRE